jgi:CDP-diacylglycerol--glycerol-3-phosphate 3-phosphatidyltransferase
MINIPNVLSALRLICAFVAVGLAVGGMRAPFAWLVGIMLISDWLDGKLAIALRQQTTFGARLDSVADNAMYGALLFGLVWMHGDLVRHEWPWFASVLVSFAITSLAGWFKYGRLPSYHTRGAKISWLLVSLAALSIFAAGPAWPLRLAATVVVLTNVEATVMTCVLKDWHADVPSVWHALQLRSSGGEKKR